MLANATQDWHQGVGIVLVAANAVAGAWALGAHRWPGLRGWPLWVTIAIAQATTFVEAFTGAILITRDDIEPPRLHALYGFSAIIAVGILYSYRTSPFTRWQGVPALRRRLGVHHGPRPARADLAQLTPAGLLASGPGPVSTSVCRPQADKRSGEPGP